MSTISSTIAHGITLGTPGYYSPLTITAAGAVANAGTGNAIYGPSPGSWTVINAGVISVTGTYTGIAIKGGGSIGNSSTIEGGGYGVSVTYGPGVASNAGTIGGGIGAIFLGDGGTIVNGGTAVAGALLSGAAVGIFLNSEYRFSVAVDNYANVEATGTAGTGILVDDGASIINGAKGSTAAFISGTAYGIRQGYNGVYPGITNYGTIAGTGTAGVGVELHDGHLTNHGTIIGVGGTAVRLTGPADLSIYPGAVFDGVVYGNSLHTDVSFGSGATTGTLAGLDTSFVNIAEIDVSYGASWVMPGSQTIAGAPAGPSGTGLMLDVSGTLAVPGTLTNDGIIDASRHVNVTGTLLNFGTLNSPHRSSYGANVTAGALLNNEASGVAKYLRASGGASVISQGTITGLYLSNGAEFTNMSGGYVDNTKPIVATGSLGSTIVNLASIVSTLSGSTGYVGVAVNMVAGGSVTNGATSNTTAFIGGNDGVQLGSPGIVANYGTIVSIGTYRGGIGVYLDNTGGTVISGATNDTAASVGGYYAGIYAKSNGTAVSVVNFGTITAAGTTGKGVKLTGGSTLTNGGPGATAALITGYAGVVSVRLSSAKPVTVSNFATIDATGTGTTAFGVYMNYGGAITNQVGGVIESSTIAIDLAGYANASLTNAGTISGSIGIVDATDNASNTIFTSGTIIGSSGTAIALGCSPDMLTLEPGAVISGAVANFQAIDTIDLPGITVTALDYIGNTASGTLTVSSYGTVVRTLSFFGQFTTSDFAFSPDGSGGSNIAFTQPAGSIVTASYHHSLVLNRPAQQNPTTIAAGISIIAEAGDGVFGATGTTWTLANAGTISALSPLDCADGVDIRSTGSVFNTGGISASGTYGRGIYLQKGGFVSNAASGNVSAPLFGVYAGTYAATVVNSGTITVTGTSVSYGRTLATAIEFGAGSLNNAGLIEGYRGAVLQAAFITNDGTIVGTGGDGVSLTGLLTNGASTVTTALIAGNFSGVAAGSAPIVNFAGIAGTGTDRSYGIIASNSNSIANFGTITSVGTYSSATRGESAGVELSGNIVNGATNATNARIAGYGGVVGAYGAANVFNFATIAATGTGGHADGVRLIDGGQVINGAMSDTVASVGGYNGIDFTNAIGLHDVTNFATVSATSGIGVKANGTLTLFNGSTADTVALIQGHVGVSISGSGAVQNLGTILGQGGGGITFGSSGTVSNGASNVTTALLQGYDAVRVNGYATLVNFGTIQGAATAKGEGARLSSGGVVTNEASGLISGAYAGLAVYSGVGTVTNFGRIIAFGTKAFAAALSHGGVVNNAVGATIANTATNTSYAAVGIYHAVGTLTNAGLITAASGPGVYIGHGGTVVASGGVIAGATDAVRFYRGYSNRLIVDPGASFVGAVDGGNTIGATAVSVLELASTASAGTLSGLGTQFIDFAQTTIDAGASWTLALPTPVSMHGSIADFGSGDTLDLAGIAASSVTLVSGTLEFTGSGFPLALVGGSGVHAIGDGSGGALVTIACFRAGTRIATQDGEAAVESLSIGDRVRLARGSTASIVWLGHRRIDCMHHPAPQTVWPVRIAADAFRKGRPKRDLWLSADHAIFVEGVLIPVKYLINGTTIAQVHVREVTYYHVQLPRHDVILAEELAVESYLNADDRAAFVNVGGLIALHPDMASRVWEAEGCAPLVAAGPLLAAARRRLEKSVNRVRAAA